MAYLSNMGSAPYYHPGTAELAQAAGEQAEHNVIILENHGLIVWGKTIEEALAITREEVAEALGGLPPVKMHCSNLAADALHAAIKEYQCKQKGEAPCQT